MKTKSIAARAKWARVIQGMGGTLNAGGTCVTIGLPGGRSVGVDRFHRLLPRTCLAALVSIDNNITDRELKQIALNRKNSLFVDDPRGGETAAILST